MNDNEKERMLDLLVKQATDGLDAQEENELERFENAELDGESIQLTAASLGLIDLEREEMPAHLESKILAEASSFFAAKDVPVSPAAVPKARVAEARTPWFAWLGWAAAATACLALAVNLYSTRTQIQTAGITPTPTPIASESLDPASQRERLIETAGPIVTASVGKGNVKDIDNVAGDIVWSDQKQAGYLRVKGLPKNDPTKTTYQLWIFDETQDPKTPIDGGTFDISSDGEVVIPIDAGLRAKNPSMFAVTIEKPGGVVVSGRDKVAALAKVETRTGPRA